MKNIGIFTNNLPKTIEQSKKLRSKLIDKGFVINNKHPDIVIAVGGDGTLLSAFHHYENIVDKIRFTAVNAGHLGFYSDWSTDDMDQLVDSLCLDNGVSSDYSLLEIVVHFSNKNKTSGIHLALNEATLQRIRSTMISDVYLNKKLFEHFRGEGLCISSPTGSTAYNKSLGGAVVNSKLKVLQLTEIASINNLVYRTLSSPMIISSEDHLVIVPDPKSEFILTVDNHCFNREDMSYITFSLSNQKMHFIKNNHINFWSRVHVSFI